jgi:hypothetical protein
MPRRSTTQSLSLRRALKKQAQKKRNKKDDRRGKHTKASRAQKRIEHERFIASLNLFPTCINCSGVEFVPTTDGDTYACTGCGLLTESRIIEGVGDVSVECHRSADYEHRNYLAERLRQARGCDPPFTKSQANKIYVVYNLLADLQRNRSGTKAGFGFLNQADSFSKYRFRQILQLLDQLEPGRQWRKKLEKWLQARKILYGTLADLKTMDDWTCMMVKILFDPIGSYFDQRFRKNEKGHKNMPKLDLLILILLYNVSEQALADYGWYFLSKNHVWPTQSVLQDYSRIKQMLLQVNQDFLTFPKKRNVRTQSYNWLRKNKYVVPGLDVLLSIAASSKEGYMCVYQFAHHGNPLYDVRFTLTDDDPQ